MNLSDQVVKNPTIHGNATYVNAVPELGMIERAAGIANGLQSLHDKLGNLRDKIEGSGENCGKANAPTPHGLRSQLSEAESVLRACHSLLDDIAGKF
jgi:hypothetical protein